MAILKRDTSLFGYGLVKKTVGVAAVEQWNKQ